MRPYDSTLPEMCSLSHSENDYVRVSGTLKTFGNKRYINASHVRKIDDFHELYFHLLDAMTITLTLQRGPVRFSTLLFEMGYLIP